MFLPQVPLYFCDNLISQRANLKFLKPAPMEITKVNKGKAIPLQAWTGHEGSRSLRLPDFTTVGT